MRILFLTLCLFAFTGCATVSRWFHADAVKLTPTERSAFVSDSTGLISSQFLPAKTKLHVVCKPDDKLATALVASLRDRGFAIQAEPSDDTKNASIAVIAVGPDEILLLLNVSNDWSANRLYERAPTGLSPATGFTVRNDNDGDSHNG